MTALAQAEDGLTVALRLVDDVRECGVVVTPAQSSLFVQALAAAPDASLRHIARAALARTPDDLAIVDDVLGRVRHLGDRAPEIRRVAETFADGGDAHASDRRRTSGRHMASTTEVLRTRDVAACHDDERAQIERMLAGMPLMGDRYRSRRLARSHGRGRLDVRATVRHAARHDGEVVHVVRRGRAERTRRVVLLIDVSGSMERYARAMLLLAYVGAIGAGNVEVFALGTRLTRVTQALSSRDPDVALRAARIAIEDWGGGTRLGETMRSLVDDPGCRGLLRGAAAVVVSDGLDRGDPEQLRVQMARLSRLAHRVIWVNPLRASAGYEPLAAGMRAARPHVDHFVDGHSVTAFDELVRLVANPKAAR